MGWVLVELWSNKVHFFMQSEETIFNQFNFEENGTKSLNWIWIYKIMWTWHNVIFYKVYWKVVANIHNNLSNNKLNP